MIVGRLAAALATVGIAARVGAQSASPLSVNGVAYDSLRGAPLGGAFVMVAGTSRSATSDSSGRFRIDSLAPGTYTFVLQHEALDSIGFTEWMVKSTIANPRDTVRVFVPSFQRLWAAACGSGRAPADSALVFGTIRAAGQSRPVAGARVSVSWTELTGDQKTGIAQHRVGGEVMSDSTGAYTICGVPANLGIRVIASTDSAATDVIDLYPRARVQRRDLTLGAASGRDRGTVAGRLRDISGGPVSGARVSTPGAPEVRSGADGRFVIRRVPVGTRQVDVFAIGTQPVSAVVDVVANDTATVDFELVKVAALDTMRVRASTVRQFRVREIDERKKMGFGDFMDSLKIEKHADFRSAVSELPKYQCLSRLFVDGVRIDVRDMAAELRLLKPDEVGLIEWYIRNAPLLYGGGSCVLFVWTKRYFP